MLRTRSLLLAGMAMACLALSDSASGQERDSRRYARFESNGRPVYGVVEGNRIREIEGDLFGSHRVTDRSHALDEVEFLVPTEPKQILALAGNYRSHLGSDEIPEKLRIPQPFYKPYSSLLPHGGEIVIPRDSSGDVHYEAELVIIIGKKARNVSKESALDYVFGVTCGNDVSERFWQNDEQHKDVQWWRAKGADTFGPCGPFIVTGLDYDNLDFALRQNGEVRQQDNTSHMIHDVAGIVSFISNYVTLHPGDLIFTGTTGETSAIKPGDVIEVEFEGVGVLRNPVVKEGARKTSRDAAAGDEGKPSEAVSHLKAAGEAVRQEIAGISVVGRGLTEREKQRLERLHAAERNIAEATRQLQE